MAGTMVADDVAAPSLVTSRTPVGPENVKETKTQGSTALWDAVLIVGIAWAILFLLVWSLRAHNV